MMIFNIMPEWQFLIKSQSPAGLYLNFITYMGNKILRPTEMEPFAGFNDDQLSYLQDKFEVLCDDNKLLSVDKITEAYQCSREEATRILNYVDFQGQGAVDFYEFTCAAASLHQNDEQAQELLFDMYSTGNSMDQNSFDMIYGTIYRYLKFLDKIQDKYTPEVGEKKFLQYDFNKNGSIQFDEFKSMLKSDYHCRIWMEALGFIEESPEDRPVKPENRTEEDQFILEEVQGEQAGSTPSWIKTAEKMAPENPPDVPNSAPNVNLDIQYVYGYRSYDTRDNLRYSPNGDIVYHTAGCGISLNKNKNTMKVTTAHNDDITCLDLNMSQNIVATGEMGRHPSLIVWDPATMETKAVFKGNLEKNIGAVAISKSGKYVAATSESDYHEIAVYDIAKNSLVAFGKGPRSVVYSIKFTKNEDQVVLACAKQVVFASFFKGKVTCKKGVFGKAPLLPNYCVAVMGDAVITSMSNGALGYWKGNFCSRVYKEHSKAVGALCERQDGGIMSGDITGLVILWSANMSKQREINLAKLYPESNNIRVISLCNYKNHILVGTRGGQILEIPEKNSKATVLMQGHYDEQLWGLSVLNGRREFITGGQDKLLIKWDADARRLIAKRKIDHAINSIDINRAGLIAVGQKNGIVSFYDSNKLEYQKRIATFKNPDKDMISVVKFSPAGNILAVGYCPPISKVYLYEVDSSKKIGQCQGSPSRITSIDFSRDGNSIMINNTSYEILFYNANNGSQLTSTTPFKNEEFSTLTSKYSWQTQGIWPHLYADGSDINAVDRSNSKKYLVSADDFSKVNLFRYPAYQSKQINNSYKGHSSHVTNIKWSYDDRLIFSTGGLEKSIIQWACDEQQDLTYEYEEEKKQTNEEELAGDQGEYEFGLEDQEKPASEKGDDGDFQLDQDEGDEAMAVKPFLGQVKASTPLQYKTLKPKNVQPEPDLSIKHAWGIRNQYLTDRVRNQLKYSASGSSCLYITAGLGVEMDLQSKKQKFYQGQSEDLISFAITKDRKYCATGQMAQRNLKNPRSKIVDVHIWDAETKQFKAKLSGFHQRAVVIVEFSPSGKRLLTVGQDDKNSLAVYDWEVGRCAWTSPVCGAKVTGAAWKSEKQYMTVGLKHVKLWDGGKGTMCKVPGKWDPMVNVVYWNDKFVSGGSAGGVYLWTGGTSVMTKGHEGRVDCLAVDQKGNLFSGCSKGQIIRWKYSAGKLAVDQKIFNMSEIDKFSPGVLSLDFNSDNYLVCTNSSSIYELPKKSPSQANVVMQSHYIDELWAESWSPDGRKFATGGDDKTIRIYDAETFEMLHSYNMKERVRGIDWQNSKGQLIVVGDYKGKVYLFSPKLDLLDEVKTRFSKTKPRQQPFWIEAIKFSPNGQYVAFGAHGGASHLEIFKVAGDKLEDPKVYKNFITSALLSVDWSQDSNQLAVVSQAYQLQFATVDGGRTAASACRETKWATWTGKFGACVQQIHQDVDYSNINAVDMSPSRTLIATGGDDQKIRLFNYPVIIPKQKNKQFTGHSSHVTRVKFSNNEKYLLSVGGNDRTIILWDIKGAAEFQEEPEGEAEEKEEGEQEEYEGMEDAEQINVPQAREPKSVPKVEKQMNEDQFDFNEDEGDEFLAVKPWLGAIKEPTTSYYKGSGKAPNAELNLQYAHGYRTKDCRNNLIYLSEDKIAYHTAALGVMMDISKNPNTQTFFNLHGDDIISMCWNADKTSIFTGEMGAKPTLYQWDTEGNMVQKYRGAKKGVSAIGVNEKYLAAAGLDDDHYIYMFDIQSGKMLGSEKGGRDVIIDLKWVTEDNFVTIGVKHYKYWTVSGKSMKGQSGSFGKNCNILCCLAIKGSSIYAGASNGQLQKWSGNSVAKSVKVHSGAIHAITLTDNLILTGSSDQTIKLISEGDLSVINSVPCADLLTGSVNKSIRALDVYENKILVGTLGSEIYEIKSNQKIDNATAEGEFKLMANHMNGHYAPNFVTNEVWGLAMYGSGSYITSSDDGTLRVWDIKKHEQLEVVDLDYDQKTLKPRKKMSKIKQKNLPDNCKGRCLAVSSNLDIIVGCKDGTVRILNKKFKHIYCKQISKKQISHVKLSPDGSVLAVGSHDGFIYVFEWPGDTSGLKSLKLRHRKIKHTSFIKHFDFSRDSNVIHSTCASYELLFWDVHTGKQITSGATMTRDEDWATWNVTLGWPVQGIFEECMDGSDVNSVDRSKRFYNKEMRLLASGDDRGQVRLLEYPCLVKSSESVVGKGHSSHVTTVTFNQNDEYLLSSGGQDQTILQWRVKEGV